MKTIEIKLYKFSELSEESKEKAISDYRQSSQFDHQFIYDEAYQTVKKFHEVFGTSEGYNSWLDVRTSHIDDCILELKGLRLRTYILNNFGDGIYQKKYLKHGKLTTEKPKYHRMRKVIEIKHGSNKGLFSSSYYSNIQKSKDCALTGVCYDMDILDEFYRFIENYREYPSADYQTFQDLIGYSFESLRISIKNEIEYRESDEYISEEIEANDYDNDYRFTENGKLY